jgi:hypothetical protein
VNSFVRIGCSVALAGALAVPMALLHSRTAAAQSGQPNAQTKPAAQAPFSIAYTASFVVRSDRTATQLATVRYRILTPGAVQPVSQQRVPFVEGMEKLEIVEAYTEKADGRRVPVDPASIITRDAGSGSEPTYTRDQKEQVVIFPDVEVGDTLVLTSKEEILRGLFPGQFIYADSFPRSLPISSARIVVEAPRSLALQVKTLGVGLTDEVEEADFVERHTVTLMPRPFAPEEPGAVSPVDREPTILISTFKDYQELGLAYRAAALPKAAVTPEIASLADEITRGIEGKRAQAAAIDGWMKKNIRYVAVYLSVGRVVPNAATAVLRHKYGDCKDKATLMSALLAAKGIAAEELVINLGNAYTLPEPPTMAVLNHAILYVPELDLYLDPTITNAAFGILSPDAYDKPVVRVSAVGATLARTPAMSSEQHAYRIHTVLNVAADGMVSGRTEETGTGVFGLLLRSLASEVQNMGSEAAAQRQLQAVNTPGAGRFDLANAGGTMDPVIIRNAYNLYEPLKLPAAGPGEVPYGLPLVARPGNILLGNRLAGRKAAFSCYAGRQTEDVEVTFAAGLPMPMPIISRTINNPAFTYRSSYKVAGRTLIMHREFISTVAAQSCPAEVEGRIADDMKLVRMNMTNVFEFEPGALASANPAGEGRVVGRVAEVATDAKAVSPARQNLEAIRAVSSGQRHRIGFFYDVDVNCSTGGLPTVRVVEQARNGKVIIERGTGYSKFPEGSPRHACNERKSDGISVLYEANPQFAGIESVTVAVTFPFGKSYNRHYLFEVKPDGSLASLPTNPSSKS